MENLKTIIPPWEYWGPQSIADIKHRFSRSKLGVFWVLLTTTIYIISLTFIFSNVLGNSFSDTILYIGISIVFWNFINNSTNDSCVAFIANRTNIQNTASPIMCYPFRSIFSNVVYLSINLIIVITIYVAFANFSFLGLMLFIIGLGLNIIMMGIAGIYLAIFCVRFRDVPFIVQNIMQVMFFVTPIIWRMEDISNRYSFLEYNPLYILIELVRSPLINGSVNSLYLYYIASVIFVSSIGLIFLINKIKKNIAYWT